MYKRQGYINELPKATENNRITIIGCNYLKNLRHELLEEDETNPNNNITNEIIHINAEVDGIPVSYTHLDVYKRQPLTTP